MNNDNEYYHSSDFPLITTISLFHPIDSIDRKDPHKVIFIFKKDRAIDQLISAYWRKELKVEPQQFFYQLKVIKSRLYAKE